MTKKELLDTLKDLPDDSEIQVRDAFFHQYMEFSAQVENEENGKVKLVLDVETFDPF